MSVATKNFLSTRGSSADIISDKLDFVTLILLNQTLSALLKNILSILCSNGEISASDLKTVR